MIGVEPGDVPGRYVAAGPVRAHLEQLRAAGMTWQDIAEASGLGRTHLLGIAASSTVQVSWTVARAVWTVRLPPPPSTAWRSDALCAGPEGRAVAARWGYRTALDVWVPARRLPRYVLDDVRAVCTRCTVNTNCLDTSTGDTHGIRAGLLPQERNALPPDQQQEVDPQ